MKKPGMASGFFLDGMRMIWDDVGIETKEIPMSREMINDVLLRLAREDRSHLTIQEVAMLVSRAMTLIEEHDEREGNSSLLNDAFEHLQTICDYIKL